MAITSHTGQAASAGLLILRISISSYQGLPVEQILYILNFQTRNCQRAGPEDRVWLRGFFLLFWQSTQTFADRNHQANIETWTEEPFPAQFSNTNSPREMGMGSSSLSRQETQKISLQLAWAGENSNCLMSVTANTLKSGWKKVFSNTLTMKDLTTTSGIWGSW